jgi:ribosomal protein S18 acetylase RimI-like enzyme
MVIRPLTAGDFDAVYTAFSEAFSDYVVPLTLTREQLQEMLTRRGWTPSASAGVFEDGRIVAFTLNGVEGTRGYDTGTGAIPTHRRRGLARKTLEVSYELLRAHGVSEYVLEVLDVNTGAEAMYRAEGFEVSRGLQSWRWTVPRSASGSSEFLGESHDLRPLRGTPRNPRNPEELRSAWDVQPSWQNSSASIARAKDTHVTLGDENGYVTLFPNTGDVPQLAVRRDARRKGIGTRLLRAAATEAGKPLRLINIDESDRGIAAFLEHLGAERFVRQLEMIKTL